MVSESKKVREILFRGQTRRYGEKVRMGDGFKLPSRWVYGGVLQGVSDHSIIYGGENADDPGDGLDKWCVYTDTLGQFTGLTDKNGKKIFEDDIVCICYEDSNGVKYREIIKVFYDSENCRWYPLSWGETCDRCDFSTEITSVEILGNIYDNPELLEGHDG